MGSSSKNFKQSFLPPGALARGRGQSLKSIGSVRVTAEKRNLIDQTEITLETLRSKSAKENGQNITFVCSVKGSIVRGSVEKRTMVGNNKCLNAATCNQNVIAQRTNVVPPGFDALEDETSFTNDDLEVMQQTVRSKSAKDNGQNITSVCSVKGSNVVQRTSIGKRKIYCVPSSDKNELAHNKNLMQPGFDPIEVDTFFPSDDLEVMGRGNGFTSPSSIRGGIGKRITIGNNKGLNSAIYDQNAIPQKSNVVCPDFDAIEVETLFPHDDHEVMKENMRSKPGNENGKNITSVGSARGSTFVQRTSIGKSKGYSVVSSDMNVRAYNKILRQPDFNPIEHVTSFPHDDLEAMPEALISKSEYDLNELTKNNNRVPLGLDPMEDDLTLPQDEVEVMQETQRSKAGSCEFDKIKKVRGPNLCKVVTGLKPGEKLRVTFYHNRVVEDNHALFSRHLGSLVSDRNMCPLRVHSWTDIEEAKLEHMWGAVTEKFDSDDMIGHRDHVLKHMRRLWNNWKGSLHMNVKSKPLREVLKDVPEGVDKSDWEWLVKEHFLSKKFKEEIQELLQVEPSLTNIEVVERCFRPQSKSHIVGFGGGITSKDLKGGSSAKAAPLEQLNVSRKEKPAL
uniref:Transposon protein, CACTA, En/Spm sub-class n=1 Tax=Solanum tuberosum TaxID=4113 RepID=M1DII4_SOLTU